MPDPKANPLLARLGVKTKASAEVTVEIAPAPAPEPAPAAAPGASAMKASVLSRLRKAVENPPVSLSIVPSDAPTDEEVAATIAAEESVAADAVVVQEADAAAKIAAKAKPAASEDAGDKTRRPRNALPRLMALGYSGGDVSGMEVATMHAVLENKVRKGDEIPAPAPVPAAVAAVSVSVVAPAPAATIPPEVASLPVPVSAPAPAPVEAPPVAGLVLYIDCRPVKGGGDAPTDLTDLLAPLMRAVASDAGTDHYTLVPYGQGPARVAALVARNPWTTGVLFIDSRAPASQAVLEVLRPYATMIVQGR
jgi:hypothetical protein